MQKTRKLISMLLAVLMVLSMFSVGMVSASALPEDAIINDAEGSDASGIDGELYGLMGDSDANGKINVKDATQIQKFVAKLIELDETNEALSDVDLNGKVNVKDATAIQKWVAKIPVDAPINCLVYIPAEPTTEVTEPTTEATEPTVIVIPTTVATEDEPTTAATEDESVPVIIPTTVVTEPTEATEATEATEVTEPTEATTVEPTEATEATTVTSATDATTTDAPIPQTITIYFTNTQGWEVVNVHYWGDGASDWPGVAMTYVETNDMGQDIYSAEVPAGITGAVFNGKESAESTKGDDYQTVDVTEGFADNAGFYASEQDPETTKWLVGTYTYIPKEEPTTVAPTPEAPTDPKPTEATETEATTAAPETEPTEATTAAPETIGAGYYLVGIIDGEELWDADTLTADRKFKENPDVAGDYVLYWTTIGGDEYKVAYFDGTAITKLYKAEGEDNYKIGKTSDKIGYCKIDFNPEGKDKSVWSYEYFTVKVTTPPATQPTEAPATQPTVAPESKPQLTESEYELRGSFNDWDGEFMYKTDDANIVTLTLELAAGEYTFKIKIGNTWLGNNGTIEDTTTTTSSGGWTMDSSAGDCTLKATGGFYTFNFNTSNNRLIILYSTEPVTEATTAAPETEATTAAPETEATTAAPETEATTAAPETEATTAAPETEATTVAPETEATTAAPETEATTVAPETEPTETTTEAAGLEAGYYLVGIIGGEELWDADTLTADRKFEENPDVAGDYVLYWTTVLNDEYKVAYFDGTAITKLFKAEGEPTYKIGSASKVGYCKIDFNPEGKDKSVWSYEYFTVKVTTPPETEPTEATTVAPETEATTVAPETEATTVAPETEPTTVAPETEPAGIKVYCINSAKWDEVYTHFWGGVTGTDWPGKAMTKTGKTVNGFDVYEYTFTAAPQNIIFNNNNKGAQTANLTFQNGQYFDVKGGKWYKTLDEVPEVSASATDRYLVGEFNGWSTTANEFMSEDGKVGRIELELAANTSYEFKIIREGTWTSCKTTLTITDSATGLVFSSSVSGNTKLTTKAAGTYVFEFDINASQLSVTYP